jgi:predicted dehydrogenase
VRLDPPGRIGLIGLGDFGRFCVEVYRATPDLHIVAGADVCTEIIQQLAAEYSIHAYSDWRVLVADPEVEVVHLATPPTVRLDIIAGAAANGKSIFCEKPLALSLAEADTAIALCRSARVALSIDYVMRYHPLYRLLIRLTRSGLLGEIRRLTFDNAAKAVGSEHWFWQETKSGGILVEHGVHFFDIFAKIAGLATPRWTRAEPGRIMTELAYERGAWGTFYHDFSYDPTIEHAIAIVLFTRGQARIDGWIPKVLHLRALANADMLQAVVRAQVEEDQQLNLPPIAVQLKEDAQVIELHATIADRRIAYAAAIAAGMRDTLRAHRDPAHTLEVTPEDARASLALALAAQKQARGETAIPPPAPQAGAKDGSSLQLL